MKRKNTFGFGVRELRLYEIATADTETSLPVYGNELAVGSTNAISVNYSTANAKAYGDDATVADISKVTALEMSWTGWDAPLETKAHIYGHKIDDDGTLHESMSDSAPYIGVSYIRTLRDDAAGTIYEAVVVYKAQAVQENEENTTSSDSLNLSTTPIKLNGVETLNGCLLARQRFEAADPAAALKAAREWVASVFAPNAQAAEQADA